VARLFAEILNDSGLRTDAAFVETTAQKVKDDGPAEFRLLVEKAKGGGGGHSHGGVFFIDEAYDLDPIGDFKGKPIVTELLTAAKNERESLSIILAGYEDSIREKLYSYNPGIKSHFEELLFEDLEEEELLLVWNEFMDEYWIRIRSWIWS